MKAMLSQPMSGKTQEEIVATRQKAIAALKKAGIRNREHSVYRRMV